MTTFTWRRFGDGRPTGRCPWVLVIQADLPDRVIDGFYDPADNEFFLGENFRQPHPDDLWVYQAELLPARQAGVSTVADPDPRTPELGS